MGKEKGGFLSPKAIANRIKSKGLQKLRWYCQMCQKQCRDENGFKCHISSESHQRQLLLFAENPDKYIDSFSQEFHDEFANLLKRRFGCKRVMANIVYQEYISFKEHMHMNSTQWETLTDYVKWLGREGHATVDQTEKGWYVQYIDRDPEAIRRQQELMKKEKMEMDDEEKTQMFIQQQIERAAATTKEVPAAEYTELQRENEDEKVVLKLGVTAKKPEAQTTENALQKLTKKEEQVEKSEEETSTKRKKTRWETPEEPSTSSKEVSASKQARAEKRKTALDDIIAYEEQEKEKRNRKEWWLHEGIVVKVVTKKLGDKYYKKKAVIREVKDFYGAVIKMIDTGDKLKVDQAHLETVLPAKGKQVLVVNGAYRGSKAVLEAINEKKFSCTIRIATGTLNGRVVENVLYEDVSKLHVT